MNNATLSDSTFQQFTTLLDRVVEHLKASEDAAHNARIAAVVVHREAEQARNLVRTLQVALAQTRSAWTTTEASNG